MENYGVISLTSNELISIEGGRSLGYYLGYAIGFVVGTTVSFIAGLKDGFSGNEKE